jgi:hypothetical protein
MSVVFFLDEKQSPEKELAMFKNFHDATRSPKPPSEIVTSKKKRTPTMNQMKDAALQAAYLENDRAAQPVPDESFTSQLPVDDEAMPGLTYDSGYESQSSSDSIFNIANEAPLNHSGMQPAVSPHCAEIDPQLESIDNSNNSPMSPSNVFSDSYICPFSGIDLGPVHQDNISNTAPFDQAAQLEVDPFLANPVGDDDHDFMFDDEWLLGGSYQLSPDPAPPESTLEDA